MLSEITGFEEIYIACEKSDLSKSIDSRALMVRKIPIAQISGRSYPNNGRRILQAPVMPDNTVMVVRNLPINRSDKDHCAKWENSQKKTIVGGNHLPLMTSTEEKMSCVWPFTGKGQMPVMRQS
ncbi:MAG: hypothetical protein J5589_07605 [Firmicutes bacterium]|nr:hypothetical protein [Bacillota bacterium]